MGKQTGIHRMAREGDFGVVTGYGLLPFSANGFVHLVLDDGETVCVDATAHSAAGIDHALSGRRVVVEISRTGELRLEPDVSGVVVSAMLPAQPASSVVPPPGRRMSAEEAREHAFEHFGGAMELLAKSDSAVPPKAGEATEVVRDGPGGWALKGYSGERYSGQDST